MKDPLLSQVASDLTAREGNLDFDTDIAGVGSGGLE
jgi:hypothetical protein